MARARRDRAFTNLGHHLDAPLLAEAFKRVRKDGATGVDGVTADKYGAKLGANLTRLVEAVKASAYRAPPVRRAWIPKGDGAEKRPIGVPTLEDKILQRGAAMILEAVYEQDFMDCSYGFRPGRDAHQALTAFWREAMRGRGCWVVEADIRKFFDTLDHGRLREILAKRVRDKTLTRLIGKWLNAGVLEEGELKRGESGTPQGGVISPLLANVYLHEALDEWFERDVRPRMKGRAGLFRYADDFVMTFEQESDARRVFKVLPLRLAKYGLALHPDKTRLSDFRRPDDDGGPERGGRPNGPATFDFLGFTHCWARSRNGRFVVRQRTAKGRFTRALTKVSEWCSAHRHDPIDGQRKALSLKLRGHYGYFGVTGNMSRIAAYFHMVERVWWRALCRRGQRARFPWGAMRMILAHFPLPPPCLPRSVLRHAAKP